MSSFVLREYHIRKRTSIARQSSCSKLRPSFQFSEELFIRPASPRFGRSISTTLYVEEFLQDPKAAVKKLTADVQQALMKVTINAADFDTLYAADIARKVLWVGDRGLRLESMRDIGQT